MEPDFPEKAPESGTNTEQRASHAAAKPATDKAGLKKPGGERIVLYSYPPLIYIWPVIVLGFLFWFTDKVPGMSHTLEAWIYIITLVVVLLTMGIDVNRNMAVFWVVVLAALSFCVLWLRGAKGFVIFDQIGVFFARLEPQYNAELGMITSIFLSAVYIIVIVGARINDKWVFTQNEIEHYAMFRGSSSLGRGAKGVRATYRDFFELMVLLAGDVEVRTAQGNRVLARMQNVPFLVLKMRKIDRILASYSVTPGAADEESSENVEEEVM
jgi:uncharacterized membrane protein YobD (UPF0266 family)